LVRADPVESEVDAEDIELSDAPDKRARAALRHAKYAVRFNPARRQGLRVMLSSPSATAGRTAPVPGQSNQSRRLNHRTNHQHRNHHKTAHIERARLRRRA